MSSLACRTCGRVVYATAPLDMLFAEERRCPRCGGTLADERRVANRRRFDRRREPSPSPDLAPFAVTPGITERRQADRRQVHRRRDDVTTFAAFANFATH